MKKTNEAYYPLSRNVEPIVDSFLELGLYKSLLLPLLYGFLLVALSKREILIVEKYADKVVKLITRNQLRYPYLFIEYSTAPHVSSTARNFVDHGVSRNQAECELALTDVHEDQRQLPVTFRMPKKNKQRIRETMFFMGHENIDRLGIHKAKKIVLKNPILHVM